MSVLTATLLAYYLTYAVNLVLTYLLQLSTPSLLLFLANFVLFLKARIFRTLKWQILAYQILLKC